jgi:hypothetical protein
LNHGLLDFWEKNELGGGVSQRGHGQHRRQQGEPGLKAAGGGRFWGGGGGGFVGLDLWFDLAGDWGIGAIGHSSIPVKD